MGDAGGESGACGAEDEGAGVAESAGVVVMVAVVVGGKAVVAPAELEQSIAGGTWYCKTGKPNIMEFGIRGIAIHARKTK